MANELMKCKTTSWAWVHAGKENGWVGVDKTEFIDVEESASGDLMTFAFNGEEFTSLIFIGSKPG